MTLPSLKVTPAFDFRLVRMISPLLTGSPMRATLVFPRTVMSTSPSRLVIFPTGAASAASGMAIIRINRHKIHDSFFFICQPLSVSRKFSNCLILLDSRLRGNDSEVLDSRFRGNDSEVLDSRLRGNDRREAGMTAVLKFQLHSCGVYFPVEIVNPDV